MKNIDDKKEEAGQLPKLVQGLLTGPIATQVECCCNIRRITTDEKGPPFDSIVSSGIVPRLVEYLKMNPNDYDYDKTLIMGIVEKVFLNYNCTEMVGE